MPLFKVTIEEHAVYECEVGATSKQSAKELAEKLFLGAQGITISAPFSVEVTDRFVTAERAK